MFLPHLAPYNQLVPIINPRVGEPPGTLLEGRGGRGAALLDRVSGDEVLEGPFRDPAGESGVIGVRNLGGVYYSS